jgi:hypothetical protein
MWQWVTAGGSQDSEAEGSCTPLTSDGGVMALYRFYWFGIDGHIKAAENRDCASDEEAHSEALEVIGDYATMEVWLGARCVARLMGRQ